MLADFLVAIGASVTTAVIVGLLTALIIRLANRA